MPRSNQFGKKALSYSILKTSQWRVTVCPLIDKEQHSVTCGHTHTHTAHCLTHTHWYKMFHNSLTMSLHFRDSNAIVLPSCRTSCFWLEPKREKKKYSESKVLRDLREPQTAEIQTVKNYRLEETNKALIRNTKIQDRVVAFVVCIYVHTCTFSFIIKSTTK